MDGVPGPEPLPRVRLPGRRWILWIVAPAVLGIGAGVIAAAVPWGRDLLGFAMVISGLAWVLRVASDWFAEHAGPKRGVVMMASILLGSWLVLAVSSPGPLRSLGFGPILAPSPEPDPYELPPAGSRRSIESLQEPSQPIDLKSLVTSSSGSSERREPSAEERPAAPADGRRVPTSASLRLSSSTSATGEGIVLIATVKGDGRPLRGVIEFDVDGSTVARQPLRVQGQTSQTEYRLVGLAPGLYTLRASFPGSRAFEPSRSDPVQHRVVAK